MDEDYPKTLAELARRFGTEEAGGIAGLHQDHLRRSAPDYTHRECSPIRSKRRAGKRETNLPQALRGVAPGSRRRAASKNGDPLGHAGEELVDRSEVVLFQVREVLQYLFFSHPGCQIGGHVVDRKPKASYAGLAAHLARFNGDARI